MIFLLFVSLILWILWSAYNLIVYRKNSIARKTVLVIGGSVGVGRCIVLHLLQLECKVIVWDNKRNELWQLANEARNIFKERSIGGDEKESSRKSSLSGVVGSTPAEVSGSVETPSSPLTTMHVDMSSRLQLQRLVKRLNHVDIIIFAGDTVDEEKFMERTDDSIERNLYSNAIAPLMITHAFLPRMLQANAGVIVTVVDASAMTGSATHPDYAASQWAALGAHESIQLLLRRECDSRTKVRTTLVCACVSQTEEVGGSRKSRYLGLWGGATPDKVAQTCVWAVQCGVERVYIPSSMVLYPLLRILPVPWFLRIVEQTCSKQSC